MKVVIAGGTGHIGTMLSRAFQKLGDEVVVLSRNPMATAWRQVRWDAETLGEWASEIDDADVVINLAGRSVNCRYTPENRRLIKASRVNSTRVIGEAIAKAPRPPRLWLQASTATIYAHRYDKPNDDLTGILGGTEKNVPDTWRFSIDVATSWERALDEAITPRTRKVAMRAAITFSPDADGVFDILLGLVRRGLGGTVGDGRQYVSWIHDEDFIRSVMWLISHDKLSGAINLAAPNPVPNKEFMQTLRVAWGAKFGLPATEWMLKLGAMVLQTESELLLKSRRVVPAKLLASGFEFEFPDWEKAARNLCERWRAKLGA